jgi:FkbM family methyltransferase
MSATLKSKVSPRGLRVEAPQLPVSGPLVKKADSLTARLICASAVQSFYARARAIPILGEFLHMFVRRALPIGARVTTRVREGQGSGLLLTLNPRYEAQYTGYYELALLELLAAHLKKGDVFYDVGAHIGFVSLVGARLVGPEGRVFAFEADSDNASRIREHARMNALPQVEVVAAAVWSECKALTFHRASASSSRNTGSVANGTEAPGAEGMILVEATTIDHFALRYRPPAMVKIDVEGAEEEVLKGAKAVFGTSKPSLICEIHHAQSAESVMRWLASVGYSWKWLGPESHFPRHLIARAKL